MPGFGLLALVAGLAGIVTARKRSPFAILASATATALAAIGIAILALLAFFTDTVRALHQIPQQFPRYSQGSLHAACDSAMSPNGWLSSDQVQRGVCAHCSHCLPGCI